MQPHAFSIKVLKEQNDRDHGHHDIKHLFALHKSMLRKIFDKFSGAVVEASVRSYITYTHYN